MHNTGDGSVYWLQGTLERRMTKYETARKSGWTKNRFRIGSLSIISYWGDQKPLPETLVINLTPNAAWSVGTEVNLPTLKDDNLALEIEPGDIPNDNNEDDDELIESLSVRNDKKEATNCIKGDQNIVGKNHKAVGRNERIDTVTDSALSEISRLHYNP